jgi:hypothetical protein
MFGVSEFNYELCNQFEYEHGHTTSGIVVVLFCEMCPEYIKTQSYAMHNEFAYITAASTGGSIVF